jgi:hypothetical protein
MMNNSVTRALYGDSVMLVSVHYAMQFLVWRNRKKAKELKINADQGFFGAFTDEITAQRKADEEGGFEKQAIEVIDTPTHLCLILDQDTGTVEEIMLSMPRTKAKISRQWNTMIKLAGGDRFSRVYKLGTVLVKGDDGDYFNFTAPEQIGYAGADLFARAEKLYEAITKGEKRVVMDVSNMGGEETPGTDKM